MTSKEEYKQMMKKYKKLLKNDAKMMHPFDSFCGIDMFVHFLHWMLDYYTLCYNVYTSHESLEKSREDSLKETLMWYNRWQSCCDDYYKIAHNEEEINHYLELGFHLVSEKDDIVEQSMRKIGNYTFILYEESKKNSEECNKAILDCKHKFFECLEKYLEDWCD